MKKLVFLFALCSCLICNFAATARADLGFWSAALVGKWRHPTTGDTYRFRSDATYVFESGAAKRHVGNLSYSGFWKIVQPTEKEAGGSMEGPVALRLNSTSRTIWESKRGSKKPRVLRSNRRFRIVVDVPNTEGEVDKNHYYIGGARWKRVGLEGVLE